MWTALLACDSTDQVRIDSSSSLHTFPNYLHCYAKLDIGEKQGSQRLHKYNRTHAGGEESKKKKKRRLTREESLRRSFN